MSKYVVLVAADEHHWKEGAEVEAPSQSAAIRIYVEGEQSTGSQAEGFVAIPASSWKPMKVKSSTKLSVERVGE